MKWITVNASDPSKDAWADDSVSAQVKLSTLSNGKTSRHDSIAFVIKDDGKVGIGTTNPATRLSVSGGNIAVRNTAADLSLQSSDDTNFSRVLFYENNTLYGAIQQSNSNIADSNRRRNLELWVPGRLPLPIRALLKELTV